MVRRPSRYGNGGRRSLWISVATATVLLGVAASAQARPFAYVTNTFGDGTRPGTVSQYDVGAGGLLAPLSPAAVGAGNRPNQVAISPNGKNVYVTNSDDGTVSQYDVRVGGRLSLKRPPTVPAGAAPSGVAVSPDGNSVYLTNEGAGTVSQYDVGVGGRLSLKSPATVAADFDPIDVALTPDGRNAYVTNLDPDDISQYDVGAGGRLLPKSPSTVSAPYLPTQLVTSPDGRSVYVLASGGTPSNFFFGVLQYSVAADGGLSPKAPRGIAAPAGTVPSDIAISPDGRSVYVTYLTHFGDPGKVAQYDVGASGRLSPKSPASLVTGRAPSGLATSSDGRSVYVTAAPSCCHRGKVFQYDVGKGGRLSPKRQPSVPAGNDPADIAVTRGGLAPGTPGWEGWVRNRASGCAARVQVPYLDSGLQVVGYTEVSCPRSTKLTIRSRLRSDYPSADITVDQKGCVKGCVFTVPKGERFFRLACPKSPSRRHHQRYYSDIVLHPGTNAGAATSERSRGKFLSPFCAS